MPGTPPLNAPAQRRSRRRDGLAGPTRRGHWGIGRRGSHHAASRYSPAMVTVPKGSCPPEGHHNALSRTRTSVLPARVVRAAPVLRYGRLQGFEPGCLASDAQFILTRAGRRHRCDQMRRDGPGDALLWTTLSPALFRLDKIMTLERSSRSPTPLAQCATCARRRSIGLWKQLL